jgi:hypothetical protein
MSTRPERLLRPLRPEPLRSRDDKASNCQAVVSIVRIPVKSLGVCRVLTPEVTCVPSQLVQLLVLFVFGLRARGNRDNPRLKAQLHVRLLMPAFRIALKSSGCVLMQMLRCLEPGGQTGACGQRILCSWAEGTPKWLMSSMLPPSSSSSSLSSSSSSLSVITSACH